MNSPADKAAAAVSPPLPSLNDARELTGLLLGPPPPPPPPPPAAAAAADLGLIAVDIAPPPPAEPLTPAPALPLENIRASIPEEDEPGVTPPPTSASPPGAPAVTKPAKGRTDRPSEADDSGTGPSPWSRAAEVTERRTEGRRERAVGGGGSEEASAEEDLSNWDSDIPPSDAAAAAVAEEDAKRMTPLPLLSTVR